MTAKLIRLGDILGNALDPDVRMGRVVGIYRDGRKWPVVHRRFEDGDGAWPTGGYFRTFFNVEWDPDLLERGREFGAVIDR